MRRTLAVVLAASAAVLAAVILGEYELTWKVGLAAGVGVALVLTELVGVMGRWRGPAAAAVAAGLAVGAVVGAGRIDSNGGLEPFPVGAWFGVVGAIVVSAWQAGRARQP